MRYFLYSPLSRWAYLLSLCLLLGACTPSCTQNTQPAEYWLAASFQEPSLRFDLKPSETLRVEIGTEPPTLDWSKSTDTTSSFVQQQLMDGLVEFDLTNPEMPLRPALATSWAPSEGGLRWTFQIRPGIKWTDGVELTAQHFVDGWERLLRPATASQYAYYLFFVKNAEEYNNGSVTDFSTVGVKAVGAHTLQIDMTSPRSYLPRMLPHHAAYPIRKDVVEQHGEDSWAEPGKIVTLGAYRLVRWEHDDILHLERYEDYYGGYPDRVKNVLIYILKEPSTALSMYDRHELDVLAQMPTARIRMLKGRDDFRTSSNLGVYFFGFNTKKAPFDNPHFRRAVGHAIDRVEIVRVIGESGQVPTTNVIPMGLQGYDESLGVGFDVERARASLAEAGYSESNPPPRIEIFFNTNDSHRMIAENVQAQLRRNLGLDVVLQNQEWKVYLETLKTDNYGMYRMGWIADYPDANNFVDIFTSNSEQNRTRWSNTEYDQLVAQAAQELDTARRETLYRQLHRLLLQEAAVIPIYLYSSNRLFSGRVEYYPLSSMQGYVPLKTVRLK